MSGQTWHDGGRPLGAPLMISVLLHGLCFALLGLFFNPQVKMPLRPETIKVGLVFKPAPRPEPRTVKTSAPVSVRPRLQQVVTKKTRPQPTPPPAPPGPVIVKPEPRARAIQIQPLVEPKERPPEPAVRQPQLTVSPLEPEPTAKHPEAEDFPTAGSHQKQVSLAAQPTKPAQQHDRTAYQNYLNHVRQQVDRAKRYPLMARRGGQQGRVLIAFDIDANGRLGSCKILSSSGFKQLDRAALKAVRSAAPFAALTEGFGERLALQLPIRFELQH